MAARPPAKPSGAAELQRRALQYLVHGFLYYRLGEPVVDDAEYDGIAQDLRRLRLAHPQAPMPHADVLDPVLGPEVSGFQIGHYPPETVSAAFKLLYASAPAEMDFEEFVERRGYRVERAAG